MTIEDNKVVSISYVLTNAEGEVLDKADTDQPLDYLHGASNIIPGLENALGGKQANDEFDVTVPPQDGYGERYTELENDVPLSMFEGIDKEHIQVGAQFEAQIHDGMRLVTITAVKEDQVTLDANHPLAGETLQFTGQVVSIREATEEELSHGHVHAAGGCGH